MQDCLQLTVESGLLRLSNLRFAFRCFRVRQLDDVVKQLLILWNSHLGIRHLHLKDTGLVRGGERIHVPLHVGHAPNVLGHPFELLLGYLAVQNVQMPQVPVVLGLSLFRKPLRVVADLQLVLLQHLQLLGHHRFLFSRLLQPTEEVLLVALKYSYLALHCTNPLFDFLLHTERRPLGSQGFCRFINYFDRPRPCVRIGIVVIRCLHAQLLGGALSPGGARRGCALRVAHRLFNFFFFFFVLALKGEIEVDLGFGLREILSGRRLLHQLPERRVVISELSEGALLL